mmetsp:Transcript_7324/g.19231  ORF Transcript_7324/g.19231 Transcript_7324/m.19231 type:complete len:202 (+) Transcript_7324:1272-1877(+)
MICVEQSCSPRSRTEHCSPMASMRMTTPLSVIGLPFSCSERRVWFSFKPSASPFAPSSAMRLDEISRNCSAALSLSAAPIALAPLSPTPFHARLRRKSIAALSASAIANVPTARTAFHEKSACFNPFEFSSRLPSDLPPSSPMPLSLTSSLSSLAEPARFSASAFAPRSPILFPRSDTSLSLEFACNASASCAHPRPEKLL